MNPPSVPLPTVNLPAVGTYLHRALAWLLVGVVLGFYGGARTTYEVINYLSPIHPAPSPVPDPLPPGPGPGPSPQPPAPPVPPPSPAPFKTDGLRVLMVYEKDDLQKYPPAQFEVIYDLGLRKFIQDHSSVSGDLPVRIWDKDVDARGDKPEWQEAFKRPRSATPWVVISNGKTGTEEPLPGTVDEAKALIGRFQDK